MRETKCVWGEINPKNTGWIFHTINFFRKSKMRHMKEIDSDSEGASGSVMHLSIWRI